MKMKRILFLFFILFGCGSNSPEGILNGLPSANATTYWVDGTNGSDSYTGLSKTFTSGTTGPWKTITKANVTVVSGDTVRVLAGTYIDPNAGASGGWASFTFTNSGTSTLPITLISDTPLAAIITSPKACATDPAFNTISLLNSVPAISLYHNQYMVIDGFKVIGGLSVYSSNYNTIQNNEVICGMISPGDRSENSGLRIYSSTSSVPTTGSSFNVIQNNYVHNMVQTESIISHNSSAIGDFFGSNDNIFQNNTADCLTSGGVLGVGSAFGMKGGANGSEQRNTWRYNLAQNCPLGIGFNVIGSTDSSSQSANNVYYQNVGYNLGVMFLLGDQATNNNVIYNNSLYTTATPWSYTQFLLVSSVSKVCAGNAVSVWGNSVYNNISYATRASSGTAYTDYSYNGCVTASPYSDAFPLMDYNILYGYTANWARIVYSGGSVYSSPWTTLAAFQASNPTLDQHSIHADPLFYATTAGTMPTGLKLQGGSPGINACKVGGVSTGATINCGAYITGSEIIGYNSAPVYPTGNMVLTPTTGYAPSGNYNSSLYLPASVSYVLTNTEGNTITWSLTSAVSPTPSWLTFSSLTGSIAGTNQNASASTTVTVSINYTNANALAAGTYNDTLNWTNAADGLGTTTTPITFTILPVTAGPTGTTGTYISGRIQVAP